MQWVPFASSITSLVFAVAVLDQFMARRKPYQLVWSVGLFLYCIATFYEFIAESRGLSPLVVRFWYLTGAIYVAAYLGMGTIYLLAWRRTANIVMVLSHLTPRQRGEYTTEAKSGENNEDNFDAGQER